MSLCCGWSANSSVFSCRRLGRLHWSSRQAQFLPLFLVSAICPEDRFLRRNPSDLRTTPSISERRARLVSGGASLFAAGRKKVGARLCLALHGRRARRSHAPTSGRPAAATCHPSLLGSLALRSSCPRALAFTQSCQSAGSPLRGGSTPCRIPLSPPAVSYTHLTLPTKRIV